jgi:hypothetical protein
MVRRRAAGGGRKPRGEFSRLASTLSIRMPADMRARLEASAARRQNGNGWVLTQEILHRLQRSFDREREEQRDPASRALCYLLAQVIATAATSVRPRDWRSDPFAFRAIKLAFAQILDALEPPGEIRAPSPTEDTAKLFGKEDPFAGLSIWGVPGSNRFIVGGSTPEDLARFTRDVILMRLDEPAPETDPEFSTTVSITRAQQDFEFGMKDARRDLEIRKEPKS